MFDAAKGLFHLFFANDEDYYYTDSYVRTDQLFHLYSKLLAERYEYMISFMGEDSSNCILTTLDNITSEAYNEKNNAIFGGLFSQNRRKVNTQTSSAFSEENRERLRSGSKSIMLGKEGFEQALDDLISMMKKKNRVAIIMPMSIFGSIVRYPDVFDELKRISAKNYQDNNRHAIIITSSYYAGESIRFFRPPSNTLTEDNIFADPDLFPELVPYYHDLYENNLNFYVYDNLKRFMGDRAVFHYSLSFENIRRMMTRSALHNDCMDNISFMEINSVSAVIYSYYNSPEYRKNNHIPLPENPKRSISVIEEALRNNRQLREALKQAGSEFHEYLDPYKYVCRVYTDCIDVENGIYMIGGSEYNAELGMLRAIKKIYTNRFGESHPKLDRAIDILGKPCTDSAVSFSAASFRSRIIEITHKNIVNELTDYVDVELIDAMLKALDYYFDYFRTGSRLRGEAVTAKDISFDFYKNVMFLEERLSGLRKLSYELEQKIAAQVRNGDNYSAENTRAYLERINESKKRYETVTENAYQILSVPLSDENAVTIMTKMKYESQNLKNAAGSVPSYANNTGKLTV